FHKVAKKYQSSYVIDSKALSYVKAVKDLGVIFDENLTFVDHINYVTAKASKVLGYILLSCDDLSLNTIKAVYSSLVISILEFSSIVWSPFYNVHVVCLERVQNKFLRFAAYRLG
uniref:Uncharacterized protein LOC114348636 n=1 Tax=Diabrotica virgifera virgifera TaxID=50390 RepID=A0A6P7H032_DIAVI